MTNIEHLIENGIKATKDGGVANFNHVMKQRHNKMMLLMEKDRISRETLWEIVQYIVYTSDCAGKKEIREKDADLTGQMITEGTTPRVLTDLIGSLCDLTSGSGDKGTPVVFIQGYFDNLAND